MRRPLIRRFTLLACLTALVLTVAAPVSAGAASRPSPASVPRPTRAASALRPAALGSAMPGGWSSMELPMGTSRISGTLPGGGGRIIGVPLYAGQHVRFQLWGGGPREWEMDMWAFDLDGAEPVQYDYAHYPCVIDYTAGPITADYGYGVQEYSFGWYWIYVFAPDTGGTFSLDWSITDPPVDSAVHRVFGANRYETSAKTAQWAFTTTDTVVLATGRNFVDALSASALCGSYDAPLLLTDPASLPSAVRGAITAMGAHTVFVIGDTKAVSAGVQAAVDALPGVETSRVAGADRYATAVAIAKKVRAHELAMGRTPSSEAFLASGKNFPDALAVSPYAYSQHIPILLSAPTYLPPATSGAFSPLGITSTHVVGGEGSVGAGPYGAIPGTKDRTIAGTDRTDTSRLAALYAYSRGWADFAHVGIATGWNYPDALGGGVSVGAKHGVLLLTKPLYMMLPTYEPLADNATEVQELAVFGGPTTVAGFVMGDANEAVR